MQITSVDKSEYLLNPCAKGVQRCPISVHKPARTQLIMFLGMFRSEPDEESLLDPVPRLPRFRREQSARQWSRTCENSPAGLARRTTSRSSPAVSPLGTFPTSRTPAAGPGTSGIDRQSLPRHAAAVLPLARVTKGMSRPTWSSRSRNFAASSLLPRGWNGRTCAGCCGRWNCGKTCGPMPSSTCSCTPAAGSVIWLTWNLTPCN